MVENSGFGVLVQTENSFILPSLKPCLGLDSADLPGGGRDGLDAVGVDWGTKDTAKYSPSPGPLLQKLKGRQGT